MAQESVALDFTGVRPFEPLDPSVTYQARVTKLELGESKQKKPKCHLEVTIEGPEEVQVEEWDMEGEKAIGPKVDDGGAPIMTKAAKRKLFREFSLQENALPFLYEALKAVKPDIDLTPKDKKGADVPFVFKPEEYMGLPVNVRILNEPYDGAVNARIKKLLPA